MIEIYLLEQLYTFYEYKTLSSAAEHLHLSQPSLSRSMKKLEDILGVTLFERQKNRIQLNETGILAANYAKEILEKENEMERHIRAFDRSLRTLHIGSCAPGPLMELLPLATAVFPKTTISSDVEDESKLLEGLAHSEYNIILLNRPIEDKNYFCQKYLSEQLYLSVTSFHPASTYSKISFADMDGQNFIMYAHVGFWESIVREKMPHSKFFLQSDLEAVGELTRYSELPSFVSNITLKTTRSYHAQRVAVPFSDPESSADFYLICHQKDFQKWKPLFSSISFKHGHPS